MEQETDSVVPVLFLISVSKKKIKTAVGRNHIKRHFREAYRKNKSQVFELMQKREKQLVVAFVYVGPEKPEHLFMEDKTQAALKLLHRKISAQN